MKKVAILAAVASMVSFSSFSEEKVREQALTFGLSSSSATVMGSDFPDDAYGITGKYRKEFDDSYGIITSFTYTGLRKTYNVYNGFASYSTTLELDYYSIMVGPTLRANEYFSVYGMLGLSHGVSRVGVYTDSDTALGYGFGLQIDVTPKITIDASYEMTEFSGDVKVNTWSIGAGYRF